MLVLKDLQANRSGGRGLGSSGRHVIMSAIVALIFCGSSRATDRYFRDISETSKNGRFLFVAQSPDNLEKSVRAFQSNFTFSLTDRIEKEIVWNSDRGDDAAPCLAFVANSGALIVFNDRQDLEVFNPEGLLVGKIDVISAAFTQQENKEFVVDTTAGPRWSAASRWYFFTEEHRTYFVIRPYWGRRVIVDLVLASLVPESPELKAKLDEEEVLFVQDSLSKSVDALQQAKDPDQVQIEECAIQIAGQRKLRHLASELREIERLSRFNRSCVSGSQVAAGEIRVGAYSSNRGRQLAQLALRRMGEKPAGHAATIFSPKRDDRDQFWREMSALEARSSQETLSPVERSKRAKKIVTGMTPSEVLELISSPDAVRDGWEYDLDGDTPSTLLIKWSEESPTVTAVRSTSPAVWQLGERDKQLLR